MSLVGFRRLALAQGLLTDTLPDTPRAPAPEPAPDEPPSWYGGPPLDDEFDQKDAVTC